MPIEVNVTDENVQATVSGGVGPAGPTGPQGPAGAAGAAGATGPQGPAGTTTWAGITDKPSTFAPATHANDHGEEGADAIEIAASQVTGLVESLASLGAALAGRSAYAQVATYAAMLALGTPSVLTTVRVTADENKGATNTLYQLWPNGSRLWVAALAD